MRITYIISDIDKAVFFEHTLVALRDQGFDVQVILINCESGVLAKFIVEHQFELHCIKVKRLVRSYSAIQAVKKMLKEFQPNLVHCHLAQANWVGLWAAKLAKVPTRIFTRHSGAPLTVSRKEQVIDFIQNRLATSIISITDNITNLLLKQGVKAPKIKLIHHGFHLEEFELNTDEAKELIERYNPKGDSPTVGIVARWMEWKGIHFAIRGFKRVLEKHPNAHLFLFGHSNYADFAGQLSEELSSLPDRSYSIVAFENNVYQLYQLFDVYVHVPVNPVCEAFGQTYVEALAAGIPSVFTLSGIAREFISHENNALVVPFKDEQAIGEAINRLLSDKNLRSQLIEGGKTSVQNQFGFEQYIQNLVSLYHEKTVQVLP